MGFENILNVLGTSTAMCMALMEAYSDPLQAEHALGCAKSVIEKDDERGVYVQSNKIMYDLIAIEYSRGEDFCYLPWCARGCGLSKSSCI